MDKNSRNRWQVRAAAVLIFLLGFTAGALALNVYRAWSRGGAQVSRQDRFEQMSERLKLKDEQKSQVQKILGDTREQLQALRKESEPRVTEIRRQADEHLQKVLTPEQWQQFQKMREEMRGRGRRGRGNSGDE
ncbi:MAG TPA: periplasmic heavy metal sensor [Pyrinomonadaceae bacterium]|nr:periplasmic heavy metal sensor [Pyrinomonadaceae bacterium]